MSSTTVARARRGGALAAAAAFLLATTGCTSGAAEETAPAGDQAVAVSDAWVRATAGTEDPSMTGAFMTLQNDGNEAVTLTGASSSVAGSVELHEMAMADGQPVMRRMQGGIEIDPGAGQVLMPGGRHVMLMGLTEELAPGDEVELVLDFSDGSSEELTVPVKEFTEEQGHYHAPGTGIHKHPMPSPSGSSAP